MLTRRPNLQVDLSDITDARVFLDDVGYVDPIHGRSSWCGSGIHLF